jgi:tetratricopeptide (TPR) repeat protein
MKHAAATICVLAYLTLSIRNANAEDNTADGRLSYEKASLLFEAKEYESALAHFKLSHTESGGRPSTLLGMAQCERALKQYQAAIVHFEEFIKTYPEHPQVARIRNTLQVTRLLEESRAKKAKAAEEAMAKTSTQAGSLNAVPLQQKPLEVTATAPPPPSNREVDDSIFSSSWFWIAIGAVVVGGAVGAGVALFGDGSTPAPVMSEKYNGTTGTFIELP